MFLSNVQHSLIGDVTPQTQIWDQIRQFHHPPNPNLTHYRHIQAAGSDSGLHLLHTACVSLCSQTDTLMCDMGPFIHPHPECKFFKLQDYRWPHAHNEIYSVVDCPLCTAGCWIRSQSSRCLSLSASPHGASLKHRAKQAPLTRRYSRAGPLTVLIK